MTEQKDWRALYEELLGQHESQLAAEAELGKLLTQTIVRLTLAAGGLDATLDPHLKGIRDAVRGGVSLSLKERLTALSDSLMHYSEETTVSVPIMEKFTDHLAGRIPLTTQDRSELSGLLNELASAASTLDDTQLDRLVDLLNPGGAGAGRPGLLGRWFSGGDATASGTDSEHSTNRILLNLLEQASWPGHWSGEIAGLKNRLAAQASVNEWVSVLEDLLDLSARSYGKAKAEIKAAEDFLGELTQRLQDLDEHLRSARDGRGALAEQGRKMSDEVSSRMGDLYSTVSDAIDLEQLKQDVNRRLNEIQQTMDVFLHEEQSWFEGADSDELRLRERLRSLEDESKELRYRLVEAHHLALRDAVTELPNRMAYDERVAQEFARWKRFAEPISMLVWDVDNFKSINDRFGHQAGDKALKVIATCLKQRLRETDFIARYGGEEFVALLCGADEDKALKVAEQMRESVMQSGFHSGDKAIRVTISCGLSHFTEGDGIEAVFKRADKALYRAKRNGKNRCEVG